MSNAHKKFQISESQTESVTVDTSTLERLGFQKVVARRETKSGELFNLYEELCASQCTHSWRWFNIKNPANAFQEILRAENEIRETELFFYYGVPEVGREELLAVGSVSAKINQAFPYQGFPVIARCYVRKPFRSNRLYSPLLKHRFDYCKMKWGDGLKAVHLGSSNPRVFSTIRANQFVFPLVYVGNEELGCAGDKHKVRDFVWFSDGFQRSLMNQLENPDVEMTAELVQLRSHVADLFGNRFEAWGYKHLLDLVEVVEEGSGWSPRRLLELRQLLVLLASIPVLQTDEKDEASLPKPSIRKIHQSEDGDDRKGQ